MLQTSGLWNVQLGMLEKVSLFQTVFMSDPSNFELQYSVQK